MGTRPYEDDANYHASTPPNLSGIEGSASAASLQASPPDAVSLPVAALAVVAVLSLLVLASSDTIGGSA